MRDRKAGAAATSNVAQACPKGFNREAKSALATLDAASSKRAVVVIGIGRDVGASPPFQAVAVSQDFS